MASDGDIFPAMFRQAGLGPLIGKRSWGGVTGITNRGTLIDGGTIFVPEFGFASIDGEWILEGIGVEPDIDYALTERDITEGFVDIKEAVNIGVELIMEAAAPKAEEAAPVEEEAAPAKKDAPVVIPVKEDKGKPAPKPDSNG